MNGKRYGEERVRVQIYGPFENVMVIQPVGPGDPDKESVGAIQDLLQGRAYQSMPSPTSMDYGIFRPKTKAEVNGFRSDNGLEAEDVWAEAHRTHTAPSTDRRLSSKARMLLKCNIVLLSTILIVSCQPNSAPQKFPSLSERIGVVSTKAGEGCLEIQNSSIGADSQIRIVSLSGQQTTGIARLGFPASSCGSNRDAEHLNAYALRLEKDVRVGQIPAIGIVNYFGEIKRDGDLVSIDLDGDGQLEYFHSCTSTEGIHFTAWKGRPLTGELRWHQYHYLGYDVTPTCTEAELGSGK